MSTAELVCVGLAALAVGVWVPPSPRRVLARRDIGGSVPPPPSARAVDGCAVATVAGARAGRLVGPAVPADRALRAAPLAAVQWARVRSWATTVGQARSAPARRRAQAIELCTALGAELRAGSMPGDGFASAAASLPGLCDEAGRVAALGGDVVSALRTAANRPGAEGLGQLAAAWSVTELTGSGLASACDRVGAVLRDEQGLRREVTAQLAGARSTARLLGVLPLFGLVLGAGIGGRPWAFLFGTPYGLGCLVAGLTLVGLGLWWTERLVRSVETQI